MTDVTVTKTLIRAEDFDTDTNPETRQDEHFGDWVYTGLEPATAAGLTSDISLGTAYVNGVRVRKTLVTSKTYTASKDTYIDLADDGTFTFLAVNNGAAEPSVTSRQWFIVSMKFSQTLLHETLFGIKILTGGAPG